MIDTFYQALVAAETWFFGSLASDSFIALCLQVFNSFILFSMFYSVILCPIKWVVSKMIALIRKVG